MSSHSKREKPSSLTADSINRSAESSRASEQTHADHLLDEALADSFPASDPVSTLEYDMPPNPNDGGRHEH